MKKNPAHTAATHRRLSLCRYNIGARPRSAAIVGVGQVHDKADPDGVRGRLWADWYSFVLVTEGGGVFDDGRRRPVAAGDAFVTFPGVRHSYFRRGHRVWSELHVIFQGTLFRTLEDDGVLSRTSPVLRVGLRSGTARELRNLVRTFLDDAGYSQAKAVARLHSILVTARDEHEKRAARGTSAFSRKTCAMLSAEPWRGFDMRKVAAACGLPYETFRKAFAREIGMSPYRFRLLRRIERAKALLERTPFPIKRIACDLGFSSPYHFSAQFKTLTGCAPGVFRRRKAPRRRGAVGVDAGRP